MHAIGLGTDDDEPPDSDGPTARSRGVVSSNESPYVLRDKRLGRVGGQLGNDPPLVAPRHEPLVGVLHPDDGDLLAPRFLDQAADVRDDCVALVGSLDDAVLHVDDEKCGVGPVLECGHGLPLSPAAASTNVRLEISKPRLEHARGVEPLEAQRHPGRRSHRARGQQADELRPGDLGSPRPSASAAIRSTMSWSGAACQSSTFIETWTRPGRRQVEAERPHAGKPPPRSRTTAAISRATSSEPAQVHVERDQRPRAPRG